MITEQESIVLRFLMGVRGQSTHFNQICAGTSQEDPTTLHEMLKSMQERGLVYQAKYLLPEYNVWGVVTKVMILYWEQGRFE